MQMAKTFNSVEDEALFVGEGATVFIRVERKIIQKEELI